MSERVYPQSPVFKDRIAHGSTATLGEKAAVKTFNSSTSFLKAYRKLFPNSERSDDAVSAMYYYWNEDAIEKRTEKKHQMKLKAEQEKKYQFIGERNGMQNGTTPTPEGTTPTPLATGGSGDRISEVSSSVSESTVETAEGRLVLKRKKVVTVEEWEYV